MSERKAGNVPKRFFVNGTVALQADLRHLAIDMGESAEKLAAKLLREAIDRKRAELAAKLLREAIDRKRAELDAKRPRK